MKLFISRIPSWASFRSLRLHIFLTDGWGEVGGGAGVGRWGNCGLSVLAPCLGTVAGVLSVGVLILSGPGFPSGRQYGQTAN